MKKFFMIISFILLLAACGNSMALSQEQIAYRTRELSRNANYKLMEMYVYDNNREIFRRITFELPVEWDNSGGSVMGLVGDDGYKLKFDLWDIISTTRESVMNENNERNGEFIDYIIEEKIYETENYEIFYCKYVSSYNLKSTIHSYYIYNNGERFAVTGYVFEEDKPEYDDIFKRIAESIRFQSDLGESISSPQTNDYIFIYLIALLFISVILIKYCKKGVQHEIQRINRIFRRNIPENFIYAGRPRRR